MAERTKYPQPRHAAPTNNTPILHHLEHYFCLSATVNSSFIWNTDHCPELTVSYQHSLESSGLLFAQDTVKNSGGKDMDNQHVIVSNTCIAI